MPQLNRKTGFILGNVIGLTILIAGVIITAPQKQAEQAEIDRRNSAPVVVAASDIQSGVRISADLLKEERKPHADVPLNAVESANKIIGLLTTSAIKKGQVVTYTALDLKSKTNNSVDTMSTKELDKYEDVTIDALLDKKHDKVKGKKTETSSSH